MGLHLRTDVFLRQIDDQTVLFDVLNDRYFLAPEKMHKALERLDRSQTLDQNEQKALAPLIKGGLLLRGDRRLNQGKIFETTSSGAATDAPDVAASAILVLQAMAAQTAAEIQLRGAGISGAVAQIRALKTAAIAAEHHLPNESILVRAAAFRRSSKYFPTQGQCLRRSIGLANHLLRRNAAVDTIFGVSARPFRAHCWVEHSGTVLNDTVEGVRSYAPILVI